MTLLVACSGVFTVAVLVGLGARALVEIRELDSLSRRQLGPGGLAPLRAAGGAGGDERQPHGPGTPEGGGPRRRAARAQPSHLRVVS